MNAKGQVPIKEDLDSMAKSVRRNADARVEVAVEVKFDCKAEVNDIQKLHAGIVKSTRGTLKPALEIGRKLLKIKKNLKTQNQELGKTKPRWMPWCKEHLNLAHRTVTNYISVFKAHEKGALKGVTSLMDAYERLSEQTKKTRKSTPKYDVNAVPREQATEWLKSLTQISGTLNIKVKTATQMLSALRQGLKQHQDAVENGKSLVVVFEVEPEVRRDEGAAPEAKKAKLPVKAKADSDAKAA